MVKKKNMEEKQMDKEHSDRSKRKSGKKNYF